MKITRTEHFDIQRKIVAEYDHRELGADPPRGLCI